MKIAIVCFSSAFIPLAVGQLFLNDINLLNDASRKGSQRPNVLIFMADDLGHADVGYSEGNLQTPTPNIDKLACDGVILHRHYSAAQGSPSRASFLTAKNPFTVGMQSANFHAGEPWGLPLAYKIQPEYFKDLGYATHAIGKWNLGDSQRAFFPNNRGFDTWYGFSADAINYFNYTAGWITPFPVSGRALRDQGVAVPANVTNNVYAPDLFTSEAEQLIRDSDSRTPFYMYFATPAPHTAFADFRAVQHTMAQFELRPAVAALSSQFLERKKQLAVIQSLDDSFRRLVEALTNKGIINNTIIVFLSDNGAPIPQTATHLRGSNHGSNWPLRLGKGSLFEGGVRTLAFLWTPLIPKRGRITKQLFSNTDWLPTLYEAVGGSLNDLLATDGQSHWQSLIRGMDDGPRTEIALNIDGLNNQAGMIYQDLDGNLYKYISGDVFDNSFTGWARTEGTSEDNPMTVFSAAAVKCNFPPGVEVSPCRPWEKPCLFDLTNDPCEVNSIAASNPVLVKLLAQKLSLYNQTAIPAVAGPFDIRADPENWNGIWTPWLDPLEVIDSNMVSFTNLN
ncbi:hypothetical protein RvY_00835 [Ramazzottius varieornatus]|uniref:Sulfatase N-terminal domain-containing protein n=1 Tax=Ramazzottius varieornatus TaxID=947166 RepID=A0A1D1UKA9_RAMVA|nr:hypothetical protein RvY_00835 [Ramazzottius varieornatus]